LSILDHPAPSSEYDQQVPLPPTKRHLGTEPHLAAHQMVGSLSCGVRFNSRSPLLQLTWDSVTTGRTHSMSTSGKRSNHPQVADSRTSTPSTTTHHLLEVCTRVDRTRRGMQAPNTLRGLHRGPQPVFSTSSHLLQGDPTCLAQGCQSGCPGAMGTGSRHKPGSGPDPGASMLVHTILLRGILRRPTVLRRDSPCRFGGD